MSIPPKACTESTSRSTMGAARLPSRARTSRWSGRLPAFSRKPPRGLRTSAQPCMGTFATSEKRRPSSLDFVAWIHYVVDEGGWLNYTAPLTLHDGKHTLSYYAFDASSSPPERNQYLNVSVDTTPPVVSLEDPSPVVTSSFPVHWTGSDAGSGIAGYEIQVDGGAFQTVGIATSLTLDLADGVHTFTVRATDVAGNKDTQTRSVSVDTNPFSPFGPLAGLPLFLLLLALAIAVTVLLLRRRRKRKATPAER